MDPETTPTLIRVVLRHDRDRDGPMYPLHMPAVPRIGDAVDLTLEHASPWPATVYRVHDVLWCREQHGWGAHVFIRRAV